MNTIRTAALISLLIVAIVCIWFVSNRDPLLRCHLIITETEVVKATGDKYWLRVLGIIENRSYERVQIAATRRRLVTGVVTAEHENSRIYIAKNYCRYVDGKESPNGDFFLDGKLFRGGNLEMYKGNGFQESLNAGESYRFEERYLLSRDELKLLGDTAMLCTLVAETDDVKGNNMHDIKQRWITASIEIATPVDPLSPGGI